MCSHLLWHACVPRSSDLERVADGDDTAVLAVAAAPPVTFKVHLEVPDTRNVEKTRVRPPQHPFTTPPLVLAAHASHIPGWRIHTFFRRSFLQKLVASLDLLCTLPRGYPGVGHPPTLRVDSVMITDSAAVRKSDKVIKSVLDLEEGRLVREMLRHAAELLPDPCVYEASQWLLDNAFKFVSSCSSPVEVAHGRPPRDPAAPVGEAELYSARPVAADPDHVWVTTRAFGELEVHIGKGESVLLGKPRTHIKLGLVGLPNVGKSSLFNLLSGLRVPAENYPFCTIDPNVATVAVPDPRFDRLCDLMGGRAEQHKPPVIQITDIAGLVEGASKGAGLGNAFLHHVSVCHVLFHVVRGFKDIVGPTHTTAQHRRFHNHATPPPIFSRDIPPPSRS